MHNGKDARDRRREEAEARTSERAQRGDAGQLRYLEQRGFGECKEARSLRTKLSGGNLGTVTGTLEVEE